MSLTVSVQQFSGGVSLYDDPEALGVSNYLYWLCGKFQLEGQNLIYGIGGGTVLPIPNPNNPGGGGGGSAPSPIEFEVTNATLISDGNSTASIPTFVGYNLLFVRGGITQSNLNLGASYFSWNRTTGQFTCFPAAQEDELFQLYPFN